MSDNLLVGIIVGIILLALTVLLGGVFLGKEQTLRCYDINKARTATEAVVMCK